MSDVKVKETVHDQPDVSKVTPVYVPKCSTRSYTMDVTFINGYGEYQTRKGFWDDVDKLWRFASSGGRINYEVVKSEPIQETKQHY